MLWAGLSRVIVAEPSSKTGLTFAERGDVRIALSALKNNQITLPFAKRHCHVNSDGRMCWYHSRSSNHNLTPLSECPRTSLIENWAGDQMVLQVEMSVDGIANIQKPLH